jgi:alkylation response protein AidB-like acyl-CoA dehydrogenase
MDLNYSKNHEDLRAEVRAFLDEFGAQSPKPGGGRKRPDQRTLDWQHMLLERGFCARTVPTQYGGFGAEPDILEAAVIAEEFARSGALPGLSNQGISMLVPTLLEVGTEEQRERWIKPTIRGDIFWCQGYSEPGSGSDLAAARTTALVDGDDFVINGQKIWTSSAHFAGMMFLLCRTEVDKGKHDGLSYLLVPMDSPGIEVRPLVSMTGRAEFNETFFTDVRVPTDQIVMGRGDGWRVANNTLKHERMLLGSPEKLMNRLERIRQMMTETRIDNVALIDRAEWRDRLLRLQGEVIAAKYNTMRIVSEQAKDLDPGLKRLIVKYSGTMVAHRLSALAVDVLGLSGLVYDPQGEQLEDSDATTWLVDYMYDIGLIIGGGTSQIQKNIISERGLGLPREPKVAAAKA